MRGLYAIILERNEKKNYHIKLGLASNFIRRFKTYKTSNPSFTIYAISKFYDDKYIKAEKDLFDTLNDAGYKLVNENTAREVYLVPKKKFGKEFTKILFNFGYTIINQKYPEFARYDNLIKNIKSYFDPNRNYENVNKKRKTKTIDGMFTFDENIFLFEVITPWNKQRSLIDKNVDDIYNAIVKDIDDQKGNKIKQGLSKLMSNSFKNDNEIRFYGSIIMALNKKTKKLYILDGQHRVEVIRRLLMNKDFGIEFIQASVQLHYVADMEEMFTIFSIINNREELMEYHKIRKHEPFTEKINKYMKLNWSKSLIVGKKLRRRPMMDLFEILTVIGSKEIIKIITDNKISVSDFIDEMERLDERMSKMTLKNLNKLIGKPYATKTMIDRLDRANQNGEHNMLYFGIFKHVDTWIRICLSNIIDLRKKRAKRKE